VEDESHSSGGSAGSSRDGRVWLTRMAFSCEGSGAEKKDITVWRLGLERRRTKCVRERKPSRPEGRSERNDSLRLLQRRVSRPPRSMLAPSAFGSCVSASERQESEAYAAVLLHSRPVTSYTRLEHTGGAVLEAAPGSMAMAEPGFGSLYQSVLGVGPFPGCSNL
jgi:hypothetical protein